MSFLSDLWNTITGNNTNRQPLFDNNRLALTSPRGNPLSLEDQYLLNMSEINTLTQRIQTLTNQNNQIYSQMMSNAIRRQQPLYDPNMPFWYARQSIPFQPPTSGYMTIMTTRGPAGRSDDHMANEFGQIMSLILSDPIVQYENLESVPVVLTKEQVEKFPVKPYTIDMKYDRCPISVDKFEPGEPVKELPCGHLYRPLYIDKWLLENKTSCTVCNKDMREYLQKS